MRGSLILFFSILSFYCSAQLRLQKCDNDKLSPEQLIRHYFLKEGVNILKVEYRLHPNGCGVFHDPQKLLGMSEGIILATGNIDSLKGPNNRFGTSSHFPGFNHYEDEDFVTAHENFDAMVLTIEFIPSFDSICFEYCFGSEEYPEFVGSEFNDLFVLYLKLKGEKKTLSLAKLPNYEGVSINQVNQRKNKEYFIDNTAEHHFNKKTKKWEPFNQALFDAFEYDGFTKVLTAGARLIPCKTYELKIIICDLNDANFDSGVFLKSKSFRSIPAKHEEKKTPYERYVFRFDISKAVLNKEDIDSISKICSSILNRQIKHVFIAGYTDSTGKEDSNMVLSLKRADHIKRLMSDAGVSEKIIHTKGKGSANPIGSNSTPEGRSLSRRVEILLSVK